LDLSVINDKAISQFYQAVLAWQIESGDMTENDESYQDFGMTSVMQ
jgi:hypothetical protein